MTILAFLSDIHFGSPGDPAAWDFTLSILAEVQPNEIILAGDIFDHEAVGRFRKKPDKVQGLQDEITYGVRELGRLVQTCPWARFTFYRGNHERRLPNYLIDSATALYGLEAFDPPTLYHLDDLGIQYLPETRPFKRGHLWLAHGDEFATGGNNPAYHALRDLNSNILFGHVHKFSTATQQQLSGSSLVAWSNGCLCRLDPDYDLNPSWAQGFTLVDFTGAGYFAVTPVHYWRNPRLQTMVQGVLYEVPATK